MPEPTEWEDCLEALRVLRETTAKLHDDVQQGNRQAIWVHVDAARQALQVLSSASRKD